MSLFLNLASSWTGKVENEAKYKSLVDGKVENKAKYKSSLGGKVEPPHRAQKSRKNVETNFPSFLLLAVTGEGAGVDHMTVWP